MKLELRRWSEEALDDIARVFTLADRSYLSDALPMPYTRQNAEHWYRAAIAPAEGRTGLFRAIFVDGRCVGDISVECQADVYRRDASIGYLLLDACKGRGVMTEAVRRITREAFETLDILRITARVYAPNVASRRVLEKNGFEREGVLRRAVCKDGNIYDMYIYGKLR